jgi:hypothetical protein
VEFEVAGGVVAVERDALRGSPRRTRLSPLPPLVLGGVVGGEVEPATARSACSSDNSCDAGWWCAGSGGGRAAWVVSGEQMRTGMSCT